MTKFIKSKTYSFYLNVVGILLTVLGLVLYLINHGDYSGPWVTILSVIAIATGCMSFYKTLFGIMPMLAASSSIGSMLIVVISQGNNIAMSATGVKLGSDIPVSFYFSAVFYLIAVICFAITIYVKMAKDN